MPTTTKPITTNSRRTSHDPIDLDSRWTTWGTDGLPDQLAVRLRASGCFSEKAISTVETLAAELESRLDHAAPRAAVEGFINASDEWDERCDRWATVRVLERLTQLKVKPQPWPGWVHPDPNVRRRVLTDVEMGLVRMCSLDAIQRAGVIAALDHGAASGELALLTSAWIDSDSVGRAVGLNLCGTHRAVNLGPAAAAPRSVQLAAWCRPAFTELAAIAGDERPVLHPCGSVRANKAQSNLLTIVGTVFQHAGLEGDDTVKPLSIRNTYGRAVYDAHGIEAAAAALGLSDLMSVAREIGVHPHKPVRKKK